MDAPQPVAVVAQAPSWRGHFRKWWWVHIPVWWAVVSTTFLSVADQFPNIQQPLADKLPDHWKWIVPFLGVGVTAAAAVLRQAVVAAALARAFNKGNGDGPDQPAQ